MWCLLFKGMYVHKQCNRVANIGDSTSFQHTSL